MFVLPKALFCGQGSPQDQLCVRQELNPFLGEGDALARAFKEAYIQLLLQRADLVADGGLSDPELLGSS